MGKYLYHRQKPFESQNITQSWKLEVTRANERTNELTNRFLHLFEALEHCIHRSNKPLSSLDNRGYGSKEIEIDLHRYCMADEQWYAPMPDLAWEPSPCGKKLSFKLVFAFVWFWLCLIEFYPHLNNWSCQSTISALCKTIFTLSLMVR